MNKKELKKHTERILLLGIVIGIFAGIILLTSVNFIIKINQEINVDVYTVNETDMANTFVETILEEVIINSTAYYLIKNKTTEENWTKQEYTRIEEFPSYFTNTEYLNLNCECKSNSKCSTTEIEYREKDYPPRSCYGGQNKCWVWKCGELFIART